MIPIDLSPMLQCSVTKRNDIFTVSASLQCDICFPEKSDLLQKQNKHKQLKGLIAKSHAICNQSTNKNNIGYLSYVGFP